MTTVAIEQTESVVQQPALPRPRWRTRWLLIGLLVLLAWRSSHFFDWTFLTEVVDGRAIFIALLFASQLFLLCYPLLTRDRVSPSPWQWPSLRQWVIEPLIAVAVTIATILVLWILEIIIANLWPGSTLTPRELTDMAQSREVATVVLMMIFSFTLVPLGEEMFFRGFLQNAFRARMPLAVAFLLQSILFGAMHSFGAVHMILAMVMGAVLTLVYYWRQTLLTPILIHAGVNFVSSLGMALLMIAHANTPVLGVGGQPGDEQCIVRSIVPGSPAERAMIQIGDRVTKVNAQGVHNIPHLAQLVQERAAGELILLTLEREGETLKLPVRLIRRADIGYPANEL